MPDSALHQGEVRRDGLTVSAGCRSSHARRLRSVCLRLAGWPGRSSIKKNQWGNARNVALRQQG